MMINQQRKNQLMILGIFAMSIIPFIIAWGLKENSGLLSGSTNNGQLITPPTPIERSDFTGFDQFSIDNMAELPGHWLMVNVITKSKCSETCLDAILKTKQLRLMLNKDLPRTRRIVIIFNDLAPEVANQLWLKDTLLWRLRQTEKADEVIFSTLLKEENKLDDALIARLIGKENRELALHSDLIRVRPRENAAKKIAAIRNGDLPDGLLFLMDPLGNLMMQYEPGFDPYKVKNDLMHLLRISQIG